MVYSTETKLQFSVPKESGSCKVRVVLNEPVTQKFGKLMLVYGIVLMPRGMRWSSALPSHRRQCLGRGKLV